MHVTVREFSVVELKQRGSPADSGVGAKGVVLFVATGPPHAIGKHPMIAGLELDDQNQPTATAFAPIRVDSSLQVVGILKQSNSSLGTEVALLLMLPRNKDIRLAKWDERLDK